MDPRLILLVGLIVVVALIRGFYSEGMDVE
jgi:hypothetical protein